MFGDCYLVSVIDASTEGYEEEEVFYEEEEEHFDQYTTQGKLYYCKLLPMQAILLQATQMQSSTRARHYYIFTLCLRIPPRVLFLQAFTLIIKASFYS